jgi:osmoprotectant transport system permease protein
MTTRARPQDTRNIAHGIIFGLLMLTGCSTEQPTKVGSKAFTESLILGEIITGLAQSEQIPVEHRSSLGGTQILYQALRKGDIDAYPDYTGTIALEILGGVDAGDDTAIRATLEKHGVGMSRQLGFNNTYALGMREDVAARRGITKISQLALPENADLRLAFSEEFLSRNDGWPGLKRSYRLPQQPRAADHSINYTGLMSGGVDVTDLYSTDAEVKIFNLRLLEDDRQYFPKYECVVLYRLDLAERSPEFLKVVDSLAGTVDNEAMLAMNTAVRGSNGRVSENIAAAEFLNRQFGLTTAPETKLWYGDLAKNTRDHLRLVVVSLALAVVVAVPLGVAAATWRTFGHGILGVVSILQTLPSMAILVFMVPLLGLGPYPAIVALFLYSLLPIVRNTYAGLTGIAPNLRESAEVLGLPPLAQLQLVNLPLAAPSILAGIKTAAVINVGTATIGALIGAGGYGTPILSGIRLNNPMLLLQGAVPAALLAIAVQLLFDGLERLLVPRGLRLTR